MTNVRLFLLAIAMTAGYEGDAANRAASDAPVFADTQQEALPLTPPDKAAAGFQVPSGFEVSVFAAEPDVRQPIAMTTDSRGRLWVAENFTYSEAPTFFSPQLRDRIVILDDTDKDGRVDRRTVFWDQAEGLTSVELGFGGVWALCPPRLLFLPDRDGNDRPDSAPEVVLDGFDLGPANRHNFANGLKWGPDGWLYGRNGITHVAHVGLPGTPPEQRFEIGPGIWRFHPRTRAVEVVSTGTTNPWGHDWNEHGELFFINTVIGHLWHAVPGAHFKRMFGADSNPFSYQLIDQTADHLHWDARETWKVIRNGVSRTTDAAGGGHAHSGLMIYLGDNWPDSFRHKVYAINFHGRRLNCDQLERRASYVARHAPDCFYSQDPWLRGIDLLYGPDGGVYLADWSDVGECHEADGVHRSSGRIFKVTFGRPQPAAIDDVARLSDEELVNLHAHRNEWFSRQARRILHERADAGRDMNEIQASLRSMFDSDPDITHKLRALWSLYVSGGLSESWLVDQLAHSDEHVRAWAVRLLVDRGLPSSAACEAMARRTASEESGLVLLYFASALQKFPPSDRWAIAKPLCGRSEFADDPVFPLMLWYGIEPAVASDAAQAASEAASAQIPLVRRFIARRITQQVDAASSGLNSLLETVGAIDSQPARRDLLAGISDGLRGLRRVKPPASWSGVHARIQQAADPDQRLLIREIAAVFGDGVALDELKGLVISNDADLEARRSAIRSLSAARAEGIVPLLQGLLDDYDLGADAVRGLAAFDDPATARLVVDGFRQLTPPAKEAALDTLTSRPTFARVLLDGIERGLVSRDQVSVSHVRQMQAYDDSTIGEKLARLWPELRPITEDKKARIIEVKRQLGVNELREADKVAGREIWEKSCAKCHTLFGEGGMIGPDLTGSQRTNIEYLVENVVDPSATLAPSFRLSTIVLTDGRIVSGVILARTDLAWEVQTATEKIVLSRDDVEESEETTQSLMPEGLLDLLKPREIRDLVAYLMSSEQVARAGPSDAKKK